MKAIRMVDLAGQYEHIRHEVDAAIAEVIENTQFINGRAVASFAEELSAWLGGTQVIPCGNGTDALQIALMALGLKPGDEVITATFTYVATAEVIALLGLTPVLADVNEDNFNINADQIKSLITPRTRAIVPVHLFGQCADMEKILAIAKEHNLYVVEDNAQAMGAEYTFSDGRVMKAGTMGDIGCTSFFPSKNLGCYGDGGAIFTANADLAKRIRMIANHGQEKQYYHDIVGVNSRLDTIQAAVLRIKLRRLDQYIANRRKAAAYYDAAFAGISEIKTPQRSAFTTHAFHQYTLQLNGIDREALRTYLAERNIPAMIYYPLALHQQKAYYMEDSVGKFPVAEHLCSCVISLPMHTEMDETQLEYITSSVKTFVATEKKILS